MILLPAWSRQEAESRGQSPKEAIFCGRLSRQEARDHGQSQRKENMTDSLCRKQKLADSFILCVFLLQRQYESLGSRSDNIFDPNNLVSYMHRNFPF